MGWGSGVYLDSVLMFFLSVVTTHKTTYTGFYRYLELHLMCVSYLMIGDICVSDTSQSIKFLIKYRLSLMCGLNVQVDVASKGQQQRAAGYGE